MMVEQEDRREAVLLAMSDRYMRRILCSTVSNAKSVEEISREDGIPVSTCYRRVHELVRLHIMRIESTIITPSGKKYETFRSVLKDATITLLSGEIFVDVVTNSKPPEDKLESNAVIQRAAAK